MARRTDLVISQKYFAALRPNHACVSHDKLESVVVGDPLAVGDEASVASAYDEKDSGVAPAAAVA